MNTFKRICPGVLALFLALLYFIADAPTDAKGWTRSSAAGSPVAITAFPPAQRLLAMMRMTVTARGSYHVNDYLRQSDDHTWERSVRVDGDVSLRENRFKARVIDQTRNFVPPSGHTDRYSTVTVIQPTTIVASGGKRLRCPGPDLSWTNVRILGGSYLLRHTTSVNLGRTRVRRKLVWHVRITARALLGWPIPSKITVDDYISRRDYMLVRETQRLTSRYGRREIRTNIVNDYSQYGEVVHFRLPDDCHTRRP